MTLPAKTDDVSLPGTDVPLSIHDLKATIATDIAAGLATSSEIRARYSISEQQWEMLKANPLFRGMIGEAVREIQGSLNAKKRTQLKAAIALEDSILTLVRIANDRETPAPARVAAIAELSKIAGHITTEGENTVASGFSVVINVGGDQPLTIDGKRVPTEAA